MAVIGIFGLNLSPKSGGTYHLIRGLMENAHYSRHQFIYLHEDKSHYVELPDNVIAIRKSSLRRLAVQGLLRIPYIEYLFRSRRLSLVALYSFCQMLPKQLRSIDVWLWPHCFTSVPNLGHITVICHDMIHKHYPELFSKSALMRRERAERSIRHCTAIVCPTRNVLKDLVYNYPEYKDKAKVCWETACEILPRETCEEEIRAIRKVYGDKHLFLYVAADWLHKNHSLIIKAAMRLRQMTDQPFKIIFIGPRRGHLIKDLVQRREAGEVVEEVGHVSRNLLCGYYYAATSLVFPSFHEGFGIPLVESMKCGLPIIASNRSSIPELCGNAAVLLPHNNVDIWAHEMMQMMVNAEKRLEYSKRSLDRANLFTWNKCWSRLDDILSLAADGAKENKMEMTNAVNSWCPN